jgi:hypothetical protein
MTGWNQALAKNARAELTQRIADYIDGLRSETSAAEPPPPTEFHIVLESPPTQPETEAVSPPPAPKKRSSPQVPVIKQTLAPKRVTKPVPPENPPESEVGTVYAISDETVNDAVEELLAPPTEKPPARPERAQQASPGQRPGEDGGMTRRAPEATQRPVGECRLAYLAQLDLEHTGIPDD